MKKILIVGTNSYIGTKVQEHLLKGDGYEVDVVDSLNEQWKTVDFSLYDVVYHVAGIAHVSADPKMEGLYYSVNRDLAIEVAKFAKAHKVKQFIFMSSMIIYGRDGAIGRKKVIENGNEYDPENFYGKSKLEADKAIWNLADSSFKPIIIRTPVVYGNGCKGNFPKLVSAAKKLKVFPKIKNEKSMIYITNLAEFIKLCIDKEESGIFYPQNSEYVCTSDVVKTAAEVMNKKIWMSKLWYPMLYIAALFLKPINKVFGNKVYSKSLSDTFDWAYNIVDFKTSIIETLGE